MPASVFISFESLRARALSQFACDTLAQTRRNSALPLKGGRRGSGLRNCIKMLSQSFVGGVGTVRKLLKSSQQVAHCGGRASEMLSHLSKGTAAGMHGEPSDQRARLCGVAGTARCA